MLLGGRAEAVALQVRPAQGSMQTQRWQAFNPSLHAQYAVSGQTSLALSYRRSLQMPDPRDLNPYTTYIDAQNLSRGNPGLKPQRLSAREIGPDLDTPHWNGNLRVFYRSSLDTVTDVRSFAGNVLVTSKQNGGHARSAGMTGSLDWAPTAASITCC